MKREDLNVVRKLQEVLFTKYSDVNSLVKDGCLILQSEDVDLRELEMHSITEDEDLYYEALEYFSRHGWESTSSGYMVKSGCVSLNLFEVYYAIGENEGYMFGNGMYVDPKNGRCVKDIARDILINVFDGKYEYISVDYSLLYLNLDIIESILNVEDSKENREYVCSIDSIDLCLSDYIKGKVDLRREFPKAGDTVHESDMNVNSVKLINSLIPYSRAIIGVYPDKVVVYGDYVSGLDMYITIKDLVKSGIPEVVDYAYILVRDCKISGKYVVYKNRAIIY